MRRWIFLGLAAIAALLALAFAACEEEGPPAATPTPTPYAGEVHVDLDEWSITVEGQVEGGSVTFEVDNHGAIPHELVILKTDLAANALPVTSGKVDEHAPGLEEIGEVEEFAGGQTEEGTFQLEAGRYLFICNIAGHYEQGMYTEVTVQ